MTALRLYKVSLTSSPTTALRLYRVTLTGSAPAGVPALRLYHVTLTGTESLALLPLTSLSGLEPGLDVTVTLATVGGVVPDSWSLVRTAGPEVVITGTGPTFTVRTPGVWRGQPATTTLQATATKDGVTTPPKTMTISVLPDTIFTRAGGSDWKGGTRQ